MTAPVALPEQLTASWLSNALGMRVAEVSISEVGTGQMGACYRLALTGDPSLPTTVLAKLPTPDEGMRGFLVGTYTTEIRFYRELARTVSIRVPETWYAEVDPDGTFTILMEDLAPARPGDQIAGSTIDEARLALLNLAGLHAPRWDDTSLFKVDGLALPSRDDADLLAVTLPDATETVITTLGDLVSEEDAATLRAAADVIGPWILGRPDRFGIVHGDYRLDNLMFAPDGEQVWAVDWQGMSLGLPARDVAFYLGTGLDVDDRRASERELIADYHACLQSMGVRGYTVEDCFDDYRYGMVQMPLIVVFGCAYGSRTERGDAMFAAMIRRGCAAIRDLGTLDLLVGVE